MTAPSPIAPAGHAPEQLGQTVVVIGGSAWWAPPDIAALAVHLMNQHGGHRRDFRHRRRPAARRRLRGLTPREGENGRGSSRRMNHQR